MAKKKVVTTTTTTVVTETIVDQKPTQIVVVLDRSGSMDSIAKPTVDGLNSFIKEQRNAKGDATMTLVQFDHEYQIDYTARPINEVKDLINGETFRPNGTTALFDAVGKTINDLNTTDDVVFVIITDGHENASRTYNQQQVFGLIEEKKKMGWNFLFLGANQDAIKAGSSLGISSSNSVNYNATADSVNTLYHNISNKVSSFRSSKFSGMDLNISSQALNFNDADREDINK
jgi:hypothetical protein